MGEVILNTLVTTRAVSWELLEWELESDKEIQRIKTELEAGATQRKCFSMVGRRLLYKGRCVLPRKSQLIPKILYEYHDAAMGGHVGEVKTYLRMEMNWFWMGMRQDIKLYVQKF